MKSRILVTMIMGIFLLTSISGQSQHRFTKQQLKQHHRIAEGYMHGEINQHEAYRLRNQQQQMCKSKRIAKLDGRMTPKERKRLHAMQHHAHRSIIRARHNAF